MPTKSTARTRSRRAQGTVSNRTRTRTLFRKRTIRLPHGTWVMQGQRLGAGGFGSVHPGKGADGKDVAIKRLDGRGRLPVDRELNVTEGLIGRGLQHVIPVFDAGRDGDDAFVVMARASDDLASAIKTRRQFPEPEAVTILSHIAAGLAEIGDVVHRDLKPANVLLHEGSWKVADFGLVRFADAATSANTLKMALTPQYAAPEQWRGEQATHATDIYALGCIGYALLTGGPPFSGGDLRAQHLGQPAPHLTAGPVLRHLLSRCLEKSPVSRPALADVRAELAQAARPAAARPLGALQEVAAKLASAQAANDAALAVQRADKEDRVRAAQAGLPGRDQPVRGVLRAHQDRSTQCDPRCGRTEHSSRSSSVLLQGRVPGAGFRFVPAIAVPRDRRGVSATQAGEGLVSGPILELVAG